VLCERSEAKALGEEERSDGPPLGRVSNQSVYTAHMTNSMLVIIGDHAYILDENDKLQDYPGYEAAFTTGSIEVTDEK
jgi:hypothetical protein